MWGSDAKTHEPLAWDACWDALRLAAPATPKSLQRAAKCESQHRILTPPHLDKPAPLNANNPVKRSPLEQTHKMALRQYRSPVNYEEQQGRRLEPGARLLRFPRDGG